MERAVGASSAAWRMGLGAFLGQGQLKPRFKSARRGAETGRFKQCELKLA
jgi:hypothetical protein